MKTKINLPTKITIARIILAFLLLLTIFTLYIVDYFSPFIYQLVISINSNVHINYLNLILLAIFLIASFTDFLDGYLARKNNEVTDLGKFLDPIADKMLINGMMIFLALNFPSIHNVDLTFPFFLVILMEIRDLIVDGLRFMCAKRNVVIAANIFGKAKTVLQMVALSFVLLNGFPFSLFDYNFINYLHITDFICYLATITSLISGVIYVKDNIKALF